MSALHIVLIIYIAGEVVLGTGILFASFREKGEKTVRDKKRVPLHKLLKMDTRQLLKIGRDNDYDLQTRTSAANILDRNRKFANRRIR